MTGIKKKIPSFSFLDNIPLINIADGTSSTVSEKRVVHTTSSFSLNDILFLPQFPVSLLYISKITTQNHCHAIFYHSYCVFQDLQTGMKIDLGHEMVASVTGMMVHSTLI